MFLIPFGRILWKEYRANQSLWLACLLIGVLIQVIMCFSMIGYHPSTRANGIMAIAAMIPVMYAIGCGAIMFASEREDGTSEWLLTLAAPALPTLLGKAAMAVVSSIALQVAMILSSLIFLAGSKPDDWWPVIIPFGAIGLIWSSFGSLLSRRVLTSVFVAAFWLIVLTYSLYSIADYFIPVHSPDTTTRQQILWSINGLMTLSIICWLGWRWCHGNYVDGAILEDFMSGTNALFYKLLRKTAEPQRLPLSAECDQSWRRSWQRLVWQERHRSRLPSALFQFEIALNLVLLPTGLIAGERSTAFGVLWFCMWAICFINPIAMGWLSFQVDSSLQQPRFLANRGVSYGLLWLVKQYVWLPRAFFIPMVVGILSILDVLLISAPERTNIVNRFMAESSFGQPYGQSEFIWAYRAIWFVLLSYGCGQLASLLFRRSVIAIFASGFFLYIIGMWYFLMEVLQVPLGWALPLPFLATMIITLWQMKPWLLEDESWVRRAKIAASLIAIPVVMLTLLCCVRVGQVYFAQRDTSFLTEFENQVQWQKNWEADSLPSKAAIDQLLILSQANDGLVREAAKETLQWINQNQIRIASVDIEKTEDLSRINSFFQLLLSRSRQLTDEGRLEEALDYHLGGLVVAQAIGQGNTYSWSNGANFQRSILEELVAWANHPQQSVDSLRKGISKIKQPLREYPSFSGSVVKSYIQDLDRWVLESRDEVFHRLDESGAKARDASGWLSVLFLMPTERMRTSLLLNRKAELNFAAATVLEGELASPQNMAHHQPRFKITQPQIGAELEQLEMTTPLARINNMPLSNCEILIKNRQAEIRAAIIRLNLITYRLEHGELPVRLVELLPAVKGVELIDPWSGQMFDYYPTFLFSRGPEGIGLFPVNSNELMPIKSPDKQLGISIDPATRIFLNPPSKAESDRDSVQKYFRDAHQLFPIPASLKSDQN